MSRSVSLLDEVSVEITARDTGALPRAGLALPVGTRVHITHLGTEPPESRVDAAATAARVDLTPVLHLAARRIPSEAEVRTHLASLREGGAQERMFIVGGDPFAPAGPYDDALALLRSGLLAEHGVREIGITGYPEGHPAISDDALWAALAAKRDEIAAQGHAGFVATQMSFDADAVLAWIARARDRGLDLPVRVGVPGPASVARLVGFARRCGVSTSASLARKYGFSLTSLVGSAGPDRLVGTLLEGLDPGVHGDVRLHLFTFGNLDASVEWIARAEGLALP